MGFNTNGAATAGPKGLFSIDPLDVRLQVKTKAALNDIKAGTVYESIRVFCQEDKKFYTPKDYDKTAADANVVWQEVETEAKWGKITGTLSDQTDLNQELIGIKDDISNLEARGRFLSLWNATTGLPATNPTTDTYAYKTGDYFIVGAVATPAPEKLEASQTSGTSLSNVQINKETYVGKVSPLAGSVFIYSLVSEEGQEEAFDWKLGEEVVNLVEYGITFEGDPVEGDVITVVYTPAVVNYKPTGTSYTKDVPSTVVETEELAVDDTYLFDGSTWHLQVNHGKTVSFANLAGQPSDNTNLATALNAKQDKLTSENAGDNITITEEEGIVKINSTSVAPEIDGTTITTNTSDQLQSEGNILQSGSYQKYWEGTKAEFDAIETKDPNTLYQVLDDIVDVVTEIPTATADDIGLVKPDNASIKIDDTGTLRVNGMAKTDLTNVTTDYDWVIETKLNANGSGYRKWRSGYMEQWGFATSSASGEAEYTMHTSFKDTNYLIFIEARQAGDLVHYAYPSAVNKFKSRIQNTNGAYISSQFQWIARGSYK